MRQTSSKEIVLADIEDMVRGFWHSRIVLTAVELDLFTAVGGEGGTVADVADRAGTDPRATRMLLNALVGLGMLKKHIDWFSLTPTAERHLVDGASEDARAVFGHQADLWRRWTSLTECIRTGDPAPGVGSREEGPSSPGNFIGAMHRFAEEQATAFVKAVDLTGVGQLLDLGGGSGAYAMAFCRQAPGLKATVFDHGAVIPLTREYVSAAGMSDRVSLLEGDMVADDIGTGYDLVWFSNVAHCLGETEVQSVFHKVRGALNPGGRFVVRDFILNDDKTEPAFAAVFALNMLVNTPHGDSYSLREYTEWLASAGFATPEQITVTGAGNTAMLVARTS